LREDRFRAPPARDLKRERMQPPSDRPLKLLSIVGAGRSGTTVLASIFDEIDGFASAGELRWLWERGIELHRPCGCGRTPAECPVWSGVIEQVTAAAARAGWSTGDIARAQKQIARSRNLPRLLRSLRTGSTSSWLALEQVRSMTAAAVGSFAAVTDARVVVETSKRPQDAAVHALVDGVDHYVLHIVRDPRAVAHSWRRAKTFTADGRTRSIGTRRLPSSIRAWTRNSVGAELVRRRLPESRWHRIRYEDFADAPRRTIESLVDFLGESGRTPFQSEDMVLLHTNHIVAGNPSRFTTGEVTVRRDDEWRQAMPRRDQLMVQLATKPLMLRYGYA
jgi:hypothetical protein